MIICRIQGLASQPNPFLQTSTLNWALDGIEKSNTISGVVRGKNINDITTDFMYAAKELVGAEYKNYRTFEIKIHQSRSSRRFEHRSKS